MDAALSQSCLSSDNVLVIVEIGCGTAGERGDERGEPVDADYVCVGGRCDVRVGSVCVRRVHDEGTTGVEIVKRTWMCSEDGRRGYTYHVINNAVPNVSSFSDRVSTDNGWIVSTQT